MDIFSVFTMIGGLALFLFGMHVMGDGLSKASGGRLEQILEKLTSTPFSAVILGAGVTAVIQSSSATTVMVVGFVNSGIMKLSQAIGIIMGANIGTTITSWILSLSGIESSNFFVQLLKPSSFSPILAIIGVAMIMFSKNEKKHNVGNILIGFAVLMTGMDTMSSAVKPLAEVPEFTGILTMFSNPVLGIAAGALLTAVIQSSSASVGILQALCATGSVTFATAVPIILGQNIGTCITAMLSSVGANKHARRAALVHLYFNIIGTTSFMLLFYLANYLFNFAFMTDAASATGIAIVHTVFNIVATVILLPFSKGLEKLAYLTIKEDPIVDVTAEKSEEFMLLDPRFLETPGFAVEQCRKVAVNMAELTKEALFKSMELVEKYDEDKVKFVHDLETKIDSYEDELGSYMVKLGQKQLASKESHTLSVLLHSLSDFERISDHAVNIAYATKEMNEKNLSFSKKAAAELRIFTDAIKEILETTMLVFANEDMELAVDVEPMEEVIDYLQAELKQRHIKRLRKGNCTIEMGLVLTDICTSFERVADHCSNVAVCVLQVQEDGYDTHEYLHTIKNTDNENFKQKYDAYMEKYALPQKANES
ncbi:MAG: Na/Pi cotransporter family protein [Eubacteriales bacterium]